MKDRLIRPWNRLNRQTILPFNLHQMLLILVIAHTWKPLLGRGALTNADLIFLKDVLSLASENGMCCLWEWNVLTQVHVGPWIHVKGRRKDVEGILFWDYLDSRRDPFRLHRVLLLPWMCKNSSSFSCVLIWWSPPHICKHLLSTYHMPSTHKHKRNCKQMLNSSEWHTSWSIKE